MHADGAFASLPAQDADTGLSASLLSGEIYAFLLLGVLCGVLGAAFVHATASTILLVRKLRLSLNKPRGRAGASCSSGGASCSSGGGGGGSSSGSSMPRRFTSLLGGGGNFATDRLLPREEGKAIFGIIILKSVLFGCVVGAAAVGGGG